jgi:large subunit ribosomal protein L10
MPLLKEDKKKLAKKYVEQVAASKNVAVISYNALSVNDLNALRMNIEDAKGELVMVKKRVFLKAMDKADLTEEQLTGSIALLYSHNAEDEYAPLKAVQAMVKVWKKAKSTASVEYVAWLFDAQWKDGAYTNELADLPSKDQLIGKLLFLMQYPVSSFARAVKAIGEKIAD